MNESFNIKRFLAFFFQVNIKRRLLGEVFLVSVMTVILLLQKSSSFFFILNIIVFGSAHRLHLDFISSKGGLSSFLLLPATFFEKFLALIVNTILWPTIQILIIYFCFKFFLTHFSFFTNAQTINIEQLYIFNLLFIIMLFLRLIFRWDSFGKYLLVFVVVLIPLLFGETYLQTSIGHLPNFHTYKIMLYISVSFTLMIVIYVKVNQLTINGLRK